jgi:transposase
VFEGKMNAPGYIEVLENGLKPYINKLPLPSNCQFMQDNNPKHTSKAVREWLEKENVFWWKTPPESPDLNTIENMWHKLKEYLKIRVKTRSKEELIDGVISFWKTVDIEKCQKYILHVKKVVPKVIELNSEPPGY